MADSQTIFDVIYKSVTGLVSVVTLGILFKIAIQIGVWREWVRGTDKELAALGSMLQQVTTTVSQILGREEGRKERKD